MWHVLSSASPAETYMGIWRLANLHIASTWHSVQTFGVGGPVRSLAGDMLPAVNFWVRCLFVDDDSRVCSLGPLTFSCEFSAPTQRSRCWLMRSRTTRWWQAGHSTEDKKPELFSASLDEVIIDATNVLPWTSEGKRFEIGKRIRTYPIPPMRDLQNFKQRHHAAKAFENDHTHTLFEKHSTLFNLAQHSDQSPN